MTAKLSERGRSTKASKEKALVVVLCVSGISGVGFGMLRKNDPVFVLGLLLVIAGYLLIRRKLKKDAQNG